MSSGEGFQVEISGIADISEAEIEVHFQKKKYGGGDVTVTSVEDDKAIMIIEGISPEMLKKVLEMKHVIDGEEVTVKEIIPLPPATDSFTEMPPLSDDSGTIVVRGFTKTVSKEMLEVYFTHEAKSGGGPVDNIVIKEKEAFVMFTNQATAIRVVEKGHHVLFGKEIEVQLVSSLAMGEYPQAITSANTLLVKGLNASHNEETLDLYFSNQAKCGGSNIAEIIIQDTEAYITYVDPGVAALVAEKTKHIVFGYEVEVQLVPEVVASERPNIVKCGSSTILVKGLDTKRHNKSFLEMYFSNKKKCGGGDITEVVVKDEEAYITYAESEVAARVAEKREHTVYGHKLEVHLVDTAPSTEPQVNAVIDTILVKGLTEGHTESALKLYFTSKKKCGGGDVTKVVIKEESAYVSFADPKVAERVAEKKFYKILGHSVEVTLITDVTVVDDPASHVRNNIIVLDNVPKSMNDDVLMLYLDNITELDGEQSHYTIFHNNAEVVITFNVELNAETHPAGLDDVIHQISNTPYEGNTIQARCPQISTNSILVENLPPKMHNKGMLDVYFTNKKKSGIEVYKELEILDDNRAIVHLESQDDMLRCVKHDHSWLGDSVLVTECKIPMGVSSNFLHGPSTKVIDKKMLQDAFTIDISSKQFVSCLKKTTEEINKQLSHLHATISVDTNLSQLTISPCSGSERLEDWKANCQSIIHSYLANLIVTTFSFSSEMKVIMVPVILNIIQSQPLLHIEYDEENFTVIIVGEKGMADKAKERLEEAYDSQMIKKDCVPIQDQKFLSFLRIKFDGLLANHPRIEGATLNPDENCVYIMGTKADRIAFKAELESLCTSMASVKVRISKDLVEFLSTPLGTTLLNQYLQGFESLVAVHFEPGGVLYLLCSRKDNGINVTKVIQENLKCSFVPYPEAFVSSLNGKQWATFKEDLEESCCVCISFEGNKIKLIGDKESLDHVTEDVQQFVEKECSVEKSIPLCEAQWRLLTTYMVTKWSNIEKKLKGQNKFKFSLPIEGCKNSFITLKGEKSSVADVSKQIEDLISTICTNPPLEQARPGTVKYFYSEKGKTLISGVEAQEKSCIQLDILQDGGGENDNLMENGNSKAGSNKLCMGMTKEGKSITLVKGDITEISVDVIVNASNADLKHIGGVALAIANKGGPIIQEESNQRTRREGKLSDGDAIMMKEVGKLPCKRLIHAVGPRWSGGSSKEEAYLKKACLEALKLARSFKVVSFPAISSGVFGFPINKCATCMIKAFVEYSKNDALSSLHEITIVVRDQSAIDAFNSEMSKHLNNFHSISAGFINANPKDSEVTGGFKPVSKRRKQNVVSKEDQTIFAQFIKLYRGELLKQTADIYVNTAGEGLDLRQGAVAASFLNAGGQDLQDECTAYIKKHGKVPCGNVVVTKPGAIQCSRIIHTVGPGYNGKASEKILQDLVQKCLEACDKLRASTIAFPALGAGNLNYPQNVVADIMINTIAAYLKANRLTTCINTVKLVIFMDNTYKEFHKILSGSLSIAESSLVQEAPDELENTLAAGRFPKTRASKPVLRSSVKHPNITEVFTAGNVRVEIIQGDITEDNSDAIVNTTNQRMQLVGSGVAAAILRKGGPEMQALCNDVVSKGFLLQEGKVCHTRSTGNLKCSKVFHIVVPQNHKQMLGKTVAACLKQAEKLKLSSIAFPAIGTGVLGYSLEEATQGICSSIITFGQKTNPMHVQRVRIVIFQKEMYQSFKDKFIEVLNKPGILKRMGNALMSWFSGDGSSDVLEESQSGEDFFDESAVVPHNSRSVSKITEKSVLLIQIYAEDKQKVDKTEGRLLRIIEDQFINERVDDELLSKMSQEQRDDLTRKAKQKHVQMNIETGTDINCIQLKGDCTDVADLKSDIQEILRQIHSMESTKREAKLLQAKVKWQWLNDTNDYEDYDPLTNYHIEEAYQRDNKSKQFIYAAEDGTSEAFNFLKMEADDTQAVFKIKRVDIEDLLKEVESPAKWNTMPAGVVCHRVDLDPKSTEYGEVKSKFEMTMASLNINQHQSVSRHVHVVTRAGFQQAYQYSGQWSQIIKIERIQNPFLHAQYVAKKKTMDTHNPSSITNEKELFHGCPGDVAEKISHHGFNRSFAGKNATAYGKGVYFACDASYSARDQYSPRDANNNKHIFLAKVLTGEFAVGNPNYVTPPSKSGNGLTLYDSVVDNVSNPSIFVIFGDAQAYPDYLITFT